METYSLSSRFIYRLKLVFNRINNHLNDYVRYRMSRDKAKRIRKEVITSKGKTSVDRETMKVIKDYCRRTFGSSSYWPWLALYTELRGEFKKGWIPYDYYRFELLPKMNKEKYRKFSEAKIIDHKLFKGKIIESLFSRINGHYYNKDGMYKTGYEIKQLLNGLNNEIIIKPDSGRGGKGIVFQQSKELKLESLPENTDYVFQRVVRQHRELDKLYPHSINTFRVFTFIDQVGNIEVKFVMLRFGIGGSRVDNNAHGGGWTLIQMNGRVEASAYNGYGIELGKQHPDTGVKYSDLEIPDFNKIITFCVNAHRQFPYNRVIGWDVFLNEKGEPKLLEWNANNPGFWKAEVFLGPLFSEVIDC